jgi:hypothetical protein
MKKKCQKSGRLAFKAVVLETKSGSLEGIKQSPLWAMALHQPFLQCCLQQKKMEKKGKNAATLKARFWRQRAAALKA